MTATSNLVARANDLLHVVSASIKRSTKMLQQQLTQFSSRRVISQQEVTVNQVILTRSRIVYEHPVVSVFTEICLESGMYKYKSMHELGMAFNVAFGTIGDNELNIVIYTLAWFSFRFLCKLVLCIAIVTATVVIVV